MSIAQEVDHDEIPYTLSDFGSFHIGGRELICSGQTVQMHDYGQGGVPAEFDPNGRYSIEQMYVQYYFPEAPRGSVPLLLWHGGGMTGVNYEKTPDGRDGWLNLFLRWKWCVYNCDAVERGRSGWPALPDSPWQSEPVLMPVEHAVARFRLNQDTSNQVGQFPIGHLTQFGKQLSPRWTCTDEPTLAAYLALLERVGPSVVVAHSQGGIFALQAASLRPDLVRALVLVEPGNPLANGINVQQITHVPILLLYGDGINSNTRWSLIRDRGVNFTTSLRAAGGCIDLVDLPDREIYGNTHMVMMDRNNKQIASLINQWLTSRSLYQ